MKKYNTPEIEALALETVDVIATSGNDVARDALIEEYGEAANNAQDFAYEDLNTSWSW